MILNTLLKTGQYFSKDSLEYNTNKVREYDKQKAEQLYNEWLKKKEGTEVKEGSKVKGGIETDINDGLEVKQEPEDFSSEPETDSIALKRDKDINDRIDLHIALFESNEILRENLGIEESISILNNYFASKNVSSVDNSEQVTEATKEILETYAAVSTGRTQPPPSDPPNNIEVGSISDGSDSGHQSKYFACGDPDAVSVDSVKERLSLQNINANKSINPYSEIKEAYTHRCMQYSTDKISLCICKTSADCAISYFSENQAHLQETTREHEERPCKYIKTDSTTSSRNQNYDNVGNSQGMIELPHQQQYKLYLSSDTEQDSSNSQTCDSKGISYQLPCKQSVITNTNIPEPDAHLLEPAIPLKLPKLLPLEDYEENDDDNDEKVEDAEEEVKGTTYDHIPDIRALAEYAVLRVPGNSKRRNRKYRYIKNWEFLMRLLADPRANPRLIRWEDREHYTFRLAQGDVITDIWNSKSERPPITYNNFARGLRYHYKTGVIIPVRERQMVYGCGPDAVEFLHKLLNNQAETAESNLRFFRPWN